MKKNFMLSLLRLFQSSGKSKGVTACKIKAIVFDFDGTLANTFSLAVKCFNKLSAEYGFQQVETSQAIEIFREKGAKEIIFNYLGLKWYQLPGLVRRVKNLMREDLKEVEIFAGIREMLHLLDSKYELAIITSNSLEIVEHALCKAGITNIKHIHSDSSVFGKHTTIKRFLKAHNLSKDEIIYVGDEVRDVEACKKVGVKIITVTWGYNAKQALEKSKPDYLVDSYEKIEKVVASLSV